MPPTLLLASQYMLLVVMSLVLNLNAFAEEALFHHTVYSSIGQIHLDKDKARIEGTGESATLLEGGYFGMYHGLVTFKGGLYIPIIDDKDSFSQKVDSPFGGEEYHSSNINAWGLNVESGLRYPLNERISLGGALGYRSLSAKRRITLCSNCRSEKIDIGGGAYIRPYISIKLKSSRLSLEAAYEEYFTGDMRNGVVASLVFRP